MEDHQQRVIAEKAELDDRLRKLNVFITSLNVLVNSNRSFVRLPVDEQERLYRQQSCMREYSDILGERIAAFPKPIPA